MTNNLPLIIAHRGFSAIAPENTLIAFRKAMESSADGIEFDVRLTRDFVPVVFHDATLKRIAGISKLVSHTDYEELSNISVGEWFNTRFPSKASADFVNERIPTLEEALSFLRNYDGKLYIEIKPQKNLEQMVEKIVEVVKQTGLKGQVVFKSFRLEAILKIREIFAEVRTAALFAPRFPFVHLRRKILKAAKDALADEISLHYSLASNSLIADAKEEGFSVVVWTVNRRSWLQRAAEMGIDSIITNDPSTFLVKTDIAS